MRKMFSTLPSWLPMVMASRHRIVTTAPSRTSRLLDGRPVLVGRGHWFVARHGGSPSRRVKGQLAAQSGTWARAGTAGLVASGRRRGARRVAGSRQGRGTTCGSRVRATPACGSTPVRAASCPIPWVNPAYFASWFPFPDNSQLDWETPRRHRLPVREPPAPRPLRRRPPAPVREQAGHRAAAGVPDQRARGRAARARVHPVHQDRHQRGVRARRRPEGHDPGADLADRRADRRLVAVGGVRRRPACSTRTTPARPT